MTCRGPRRRMLPEKAAAGGEGRGWLARRAGQFQQLRPPTSFPAVQVAQEILDAAGERHGASSGPPQEAST